MKIAILLCGHLRVYDKTYQTFRNCFSGLDYDVFCHTWDTIGHTDPVWWSEKGDDIYQKISQDQIDKIYDFYNPKKVWIETQTKYLSLREDYNKIKGYNAVKNLWETVGRCNKIRIDYEEKTGIKYDCILKTRYDIFYEEKFDPGVIEYNTNKYKFAFLNTYTDHIHNLYNDSIFFARPEVFTNTINGIRNKVDNYLYASIDKFKIIEGEASFTEYLRKEIGDDSEFVKFNLKCKILRFSGKVLPLYF